MLSEMGLRLFQPQSHPGRTVDTPPEPPRQAGGKPALTAGVARTPAPVVRAPAVLSSPGLSSHPAGIDAMDWDAIGSAVGACSACKLCNGRRNAVTGAGDPQADWMVVGDPPDENEDMHGTPFAGDAGQLLDNMLRAIGADRSKGAYITNVLKCRPAGNRNPDAEELAQCEHFLRRQVALVQPRVILAMGRFAVQSLLQTTDPIGKLRGRVHQYNGVPVVVTFHPVHLLRNLPDKARAWTDLCLAMAAIEAGPAALPQGEGSGL